MEENVVFEFRVQYKMLGGTKVHQSTFVSSGVKEVMDALKTEGVTPATVDHLYVHQQLPDGKVAEVVTVEPDRPHVKPNQPVLDETRLPDNVVDITVRRAKNKKEKRAERRRQEAQARQAKNDKPRLKVKTIGSSDARPVYSMFYKAVTL